MQTGHLHAEFTDKMHVMLHHYDGVVFGDMFEKPCSFLGLGIGHARHRFIDQKKLRILGQQHADLEPLFLAMGKIGRKRAPFSGKPHGFQYAGDLPGLIGRRAMKQGSERATLAFHGKQDVVFHRMTFKNSWFFYCIE